MAVATMAERQWEPITDFWEADRAFNALDQRAREWAGIMAAATAELIDVLAEVDARGFCEQFGFRSLEQWASLRCGVSFAHAKRLVSVARVLGGLPVVREKFASGAVSEDQMVEIAKAGVTPLHDREAADFASVMSVPQLRKALSFLPEVPDPKPGDDRAADNPPAEDPPAEDPPAGNPATGEAPVDPAPAGGDAAAREWLHFGETGHGVWELHLRLSMERGAVVEKAIDAGRDREYQDRHGEPGDANDPPTGVSNLDGFLRLIGDALDVADPQTRRGKAPSDRYLVNVHLHPDGNSNIHLGARLPNATRDELCCDAEVRAWLHHPDGTIGLGRRARVVSPRLRVVVEHRDGGCVVPGCRSRWRLRIHHLQTWFDGGRTDTDNLVCLCPAHHAAVHRGEFRITGNPDVGTLVVADRWGRPFQVGTPTPPTDGRLAAATLRTSASPWRAGEKAQWHWVTWTDPNWRPPAPTRPPAEPREPTVFDRYDFQYLSPPWMRHAGGGRRSRGDDGDSDDDVTYG